MVNKYKINNHLSLLTSTNWTLKKNHHIWLGTWDLGHAQKWKNVYSIAEMLPLALSVKTLIQQIIKIL
jgi:hypothetical protein